MNCCYPVRQVVECQNCKRFRLIPPPESRRITPIIDASVVHKAGKPCPLWKPYGG